MTPSFPRTGVSGHAGAVQRGDGNLHPESPYARNASNVSSDPKPREGTETRNPAPHPQLRHAPEVVRPKTPRGDGNARNRPTWACPQRVVRPKTPRGDGNSITLFLSVARLRVSSDPKPREGTETRKRSTSLTILFSRRQTQNPERGRKRPVDGGCVVRASVVRPKTPRGDGNPTMASKSAWVTDPGRQTQNPERGRKLVRHLCLIQVQCPVVRPKTPRGDGNLTARSFPASIR
ncbi:Uncharacterised protein [Mycobacterium tuberculosis]|nr:Uncharacterised protein [Mycobacterium tuberculosis]